MKVFLYIFAAICGYIIAGINPAIILSKVIYKKDIRECGSGNAGFTNFKRTFGNKWAWCVFVFDFAKAVFVVGQMAWYLSQHGIAFQFAAAYTGFFCILGHAFPIQYKFKGGKGFLVCLSVIYIVDWRVGMIATGMMVVLLLTTKYMSLSTTFALLLCPVLLLLMETSVSASLMVTACVMLVAFRHKENYMRLAQGKEPKFALRSKSSE